MTDLRLVVVADDPHSASALRGALRATAAFEVLDGYLDGRSSCAAAVRDYEPDVVVIDHMQQHDDTLARIRELRAELPDAKLILLPTSMEPSLLAKAARAGVDAAIAKTFRLEGLSALIRAVVAGNVYHAFDAPHAAWEQPVDSGGRPVESGLTSLTRREMEVLRLVAAGTPNSRIAAQLWITEQTVKFHLSRVYRKLGVSNRTEASHHAYVHGLFESAPPTGVAA